MNVEKQIVDKPQNGYVSFATIRGFPMRYVAKNLLRRLPQ